MSLKKCVACKRPFNWENFPKCPHCGWDKRQWKQKWMSGMQSAIQNPDMLDKGGKTGTDLLFTNLHEFGVESLQSGFMIVVQDYVEQAPDVLPGTLKDALSANLEQSHPFRQHQQNALKEFDLPQGFADRQQPSEYDVAPLADAANQHEWLIYPGEDVLKTAAQGYKDIMCPVRDQLISQNGKTNVTPESVEFAIYQSLLMDVFSPVGAIIPALMAVWLRKSTFDLDTFCQ